MGCAVAVCVSWLLSAGCVTLGEFELLEKRVATVELERDRLKASMAEDVVRLENLHGQLTKAEETLRRSGANLGIRMEQVEAATQVHAGQLEATTFQLRAASRTIEALKQEIFDRLGASVLYLPTELPKEPGKVWDLAVKAKKANKTRQARALFDYFEASFSDHDKADDALLSIAQLAEGDGDMDRAIKVYDQVHTRYPDGDQAAPALWRMAVLFENRGKCVPARKVYEHIAVAYKESKLAPKAEKQAAKLAESCSDEP